MLLEVKDVSKKFVPTQKTLREKIAVERASFALERGEFISIVGKSGSGKSTLLNLIAGLLDPTSGSVKFEGREITVLGAREKAAFRNEKVGYISQNQTLLSNLTVFENVVLPFFLAKRKNADLKRTEEKIRSVLESLGIGNLSDAYPESLSGGELHRALIARALTNDPALILADEPTGDIDDENKAAVMKILKSLSAAGKSVIVVTHDRETSEYAEKIYRMADGVLSAPARE